MVERLQQCRSRCVVVLLRSCTVVQWTQLRILTVRHSLRKICLAGWLLGGWVAGWLGGWVAGWLSVRAG